MSTVTKIELAVEPVERMVRERGHVYGDCLNATLQKGDKDFWRVEFAYEGTTNRIKTTGPPSIILDVNLASEDVQSVELM